MYQFLLALPAILCLFTSMSIFGACCQSAEIAVGWRRDDLEWKTKHLDSSYIPGHANSRIHFKDINMYTLSGKAKWVANSYYVRLSGDYGLTDKGRARERFQIKSPFLYHPIEVHTSNPIKRRSEVYDADIAAGYPFSLLCHRMTFVPLVGFSFHRQHLRVKDKRRDQSSSYCCPFDSYSCCSDSHKTYNSAFYSVYSHISRSYSSSSYYSPSSSDFSVLSSNPFVHSPSSDPFSYSESDHNIAYSLGLSNHHRTENYRFTWYGFYLGADIAYALDCNWTLYGEFEGHFLNNCHRKRKSWTGVQFVDEYHEKGFAYGYNAQIGLTYYIANCWYSTLSVDYKWWKADSHSHHDQIHWQTVGVNVGLGYMF